MTEPRHTYVTYDWVPYSAEKVFAFFAQPKNLPRLMPHWQRPRIDALALVPPPPGPRGHVDGAAGQGSRITLSFRPVPFSPIRLRWLALIDDFAWNDHFCDYELRGPFAYWRHCHRVEAETRDTLAGARITDEVHYTLPLGPLGPLANLTFMHWQMVAIFAYRKKMLRKLLQ